LPSDILSRLHKADALHKKLFQGHGPFSGFANRIDVARSLGLIDDRIRSDLKDIGWIRNRFAHQMAACRTELSFETREIASKCRELWSPDNLDIAIVKKRNPPSAPRERLLDATMQINAWLVDEIDRSEYKVEPHRWNTG